MVHERDVVTWTTSGTQPIDDTFSLRKDEEGKYGDKFPFSQHTVWCGDEVSLKLRSGKLESETSGDMNKERYSLSQRLNYVTLNSATRFSYGNPSYQKTEKCTTT